MNVSNQGKRRGIKLIEVTLVIAILGLLTGLVATGVHQIRTSAARTTTICYLRQLIVATHNAHDTYKGFPPYLGLYPDTPTGKNGTVYFHMLPYIDGNLLYKVDNTTAAFQPYQGPLDPTAGDGTGPSGAGVTSFLCNTLAFPVGPPYSSMPGSFANGTSNTVFFVTATADGSGTWHYWGNTNPDTATYFVGGTPMPPQPLGRNGTCGFRTPCQLTPGGGSIVAMGDASTRSLSPHILAAVWQTVTNPASMTPIPSNWNQ